MSGSVSPLCILLILFSNVQSQGDVPPATEQQTPAEVQSPSLRGGENPHLQSEQNKEREIGTGFAKDTFSLEIKGSRGFGTTAFGPNHSHDLWLTHVQFGWVMADVMEPGYWFGGNIEALGQIMIGGQDNPESAYFVGGAAGFRYHFRTGTALVPFLVGSFGCAVTDIEGPDLGGKFQFNEQIGAGMRYFISRTRALCLEYNLWHVSNGSTREPNDGLNAHVVSLGFGWLF